MPDRTAHHLVTIPNLLTVLRLLLIPFFVAASLTSHFEIAFFTFVGAGITDILDGWIARRWNQRSRLGALLDPAADKMMMFAGYVLFTFSSRPAFLLPHWLTFVIFIRDAMIVVFAYLLYTRIHIKRFPPSIPGKISTVLQVVTLSATIAANTFIRPVAEPLLWFLFRASLLMTIYSGADYIRRADQTLNRIDEQAKAA